MTEIRLHDLIQIAQQHFEEGNCYKSKADTVFSRTRLLRAFTHTQRVVKILNVHDIGVISQHRQLNKHIEVMIERCVAYWKWVPGRVP